MTAINQFEYNLLHGSSDDFERLHHNYNKMLVAFLGTLKIIKVSSDMSEVLQMTWIRVYLKRDLFNPEFLFRNWLYKVAVRVAINFQRQEKRQLYGSCEEFVQDAPEPSEGVLTRELQEVVQRAIAQLPDDEREVVNSIYFQGSETTNGQHRATVRRARRKLQKLLKGVNNEC